MARLGGALAEAGLEAVAVGAERGGALRGAWRLVVLLQVVQVAHRQLQDVGLLQLGHVFALILQRRHHQLLQLVQTPVDPRPPLPFQQWLCNLRANKTTPAPLKIFLGYNFTRITLLLASLQTK